MICAGICHDPCTMEGKVLFHFSRIIDFKKTTGYTENMKNRRAAVGIVVEGELTHGKDDRHWEPGF